MSVLLGISGVQRNACAAVCVAGAIRAACEEERLTRIRAIGIDSRGLPTEAVRQVLALSGCRRDDLQAWVVAEPQVRVPEALPSVAVDHHEAHAATAFLASPFERAAVLVCDGNANRELSVWIGDGTHLTDQHWPWRGRALATLYAECAQIFANGQPMPTHRLEALAHLGRGDHAERVSRLFRYVDGTLVVDSHYRAHLMEMLREEQQRGSLPVETASAVQRAIGEALVDLAADIRARTGADALCVGGGLFYNTYFTTLLRRSGIFDDVFVPINPGNSGLAVGATMLLAASDGPRGVRPPVSPFLGPEYDSEAIKATLDGCKLSYAFVRESEAIDTAVDALMRGQLVGWFQGRMEWGHRALGHRSILASPQSPYVLENLNAFLRKRERWRPFGVSVCADSVSDLFCGPPSSPFMQYEYTPRDRERLRHVMPAGATSVRVQTVDPGMKPFWTLHKRVQQACGTGALVNTSFNGFHEPIVCSPADAVRVFYGTGLDVLVIGRFVLRK